MNSEIGTDTIHALMGSPVIAGDHVYGVCNFGQLRALLVLTYRDDEIGLVGKDASGNPLIQDLAAMPHMLIAGTTGSGKSVCMNSIIMSFLFTKRPDELKLVLVDPKMVEMSMFKDIPHLMCPVINETGRATSVLDWACEKMDERYEFLAEAGVRNLKGYNSLTQEELIERSRLTFLKLIDHPDFPELKQHGHQPSHVFRGAKADIFEGGHRVPLIVRDATPADVPAAPAA